MFDFYNMEFISLTVNTVVSKYNTFKLNSIKLHGRVKLCLRLFCVTIVLYLRTLRWSPFGLIRDDVCRCKLDLRTPDE